MSKIMYDQKDARCSFPWGTGNITFSRFISQVEHFLSMPSIYVLCEIWNSVTTNNKIQDQGHSDILYSFMLNKNDH